MDRIKNKLFVHRAPTSKPALMALLADAFFHVTGIPLGDDEEAHMPQEKVDGMTWQTISPRQFNEIFTRVVTESGLPDEPIDIGRPDGSPLPSAPPTTKDSLRTTHYKPAPGTNPYDDVAAQLSGLARSGNPVYREILGRGDSPTVVIPLNGGRTLRLEQLTRLCTEDVMYHMRMTTDEQSQVLKETSFDWILSRLREDYEAHPENYRDMQDVPAFPISSLLKTATPLPNGSEAVLEKIRNALFLTPVPQSAAVLAETLSDTYLSVTGLASLTDDLLVNLPIGKRDLGAAGHLISPLAFTNLFQRAIDDTYSSDPQGVQWTVSQDVQDAEQVAPSRQ